MVTGIACQRCEAVVEQSILESSISLIRPGKVLTWSYTTLACACRALQPALPETLIDNSCYILHKILIFTALFVLQVSPLRSAGASAAEAAITEQRRY